MFTWIKKLFGSKPKAEEIPQEYEYDCEDVIVKIYTNDLTYTVKFYTAIIRDYYRECLNDWKPVYVLRTGKEAYENWKDNIQTNTILNVKGEQILVHSITKFEHEVIPVKFKSKHNVKK